VLVKQVTTVEVTVVMAVIAEKTKEEIKTKQIQTNQTLMLVIGRFRVSEMIAFERG